MTTRTLLALPLLVLLGCPPAGDAPLPEDEERGTTCADADMDGVDDCGADGVLGTADDDCDDQDAAVYPGAPETCGGADDLDCDGLAPEACCTSGLEVFASSDACAASEWALGLVVGECLVPELRDELDAMEACGCPTSTTTSSTAPVPGGADCGGPGTALMLTTTTTMYGSTCPSGAGTISGSLDGLFTRMSCGSFSNNQTDTVTGTSLTLAVPGCTSLGQLDMDGYAAESYNSDYNVSFSRTCEFGVDLSRGGSFASPELNARFPEGPVTSLQLETLTQTAQEVPNSPYRNVDGWGTVTSTGGMWELTLTDVRHRQSMEGCWEEPWQGSLTLALRASPGQAPYATYEVTFDGATACDACVPVTLDGAPIAPWCSTSFAPQLNF